MMTGTTVQSRVLGRRGRYTAIGHSPKRCTRTSPRSAPRNGATPISSSRALCSARSACRSTDSSTEIDAEVEGVEQIPEEEQVGGVSDDIGDVTWSVPTATLLFPSNVAGTTTHHWTAAIAMATPVAHKGATQGAKVHAMTVLDIVTNPQLVESARDYLETVQGKQATYQPLIRPEDVPATWLNKETMDRLRPELAKHYYDARKFGSYLEQLGVQYPPPLPPESLPAR